MAGSIGKAGSCLNQKKIDFLSRWHSQLSIPRDNMTKRFRFDKRFETRSSTRANWQIGRGSLIGRAYQEWSSAGCLWIQTQAYKGLFKPQKNIRIILGLLTTKLSPGKAISTLPPGYVWSMMKPLYTLCASVWHLLKLVEASGRNLEVGNILNFLTVIGLLDILQSTGIL